MHKYGLAEHVRWRTEVTAAEWDDADGMWAVFVRTHDGETRAVQTRAVITAVGQLNRPYIPEFDGAGMFAGPSFHSAA